ncbi:ABC transporter ATP-binding protein [Profundibacterium mesophilum]|uniref:ABC transporter nucleotide bindingATPase protein n=1 Tax=Profundibacterium mesophilum KAUST100406-0324 TaxID=1037889 RepID=A0A921TC43_9RHOB|nr:ABC transporter ATP-binding protein [Profundibacterium mesophilum]KAF0675238.1 ABC transporter nucleotide bindingATPase protein [Profundibacterium mesophilum KAUST100406-0324]
MPDQTNTDAEAAPAGRCPIIELSGAHKHFGDYHALRGIDLSVGAGEFFSLLGPSGCGKTTLLRTIAGFEALGAGRLVIGGRDMAGVPPNRRPTNMVFQSYAIFPHLDVGQNVGFGLRRSEGSRAQKAVRIGEALEMVGLAGYERRGAQALSGGQRQRVALARALILRPDVLLLDEPLSALDKKLREQMQAELRRLQRQVGITFVLVTHDQEEALIMSDRVAVMFEGRIAQLAGPQELYRHPASRRVAEFIGMMNFLPVIATGDTLEIAGLGRVPRAGLRSAAPDGQGPPEAGIRPEMFSILYPGEQTGRRTAQGTVRETAFYGDMTYYEVILDGTERPVTISMKNMPGRMILSPGTQARIAWDAESVTLFSAAW